MDVSTVASMIREAKQGASICLWPDYDIKAIPFAIYDDKQVVYIDHPNPPEARPEQLMAATSVPINEIATATIPAEMCKNEPDVLPLAYHEGFHVFQEHHFTRFEADMFTAMAFYPELDAEYRALCRLEEDILRNTDDNIDQKVSMLGHLMTLRRARLNAHPSLLDYERYLERSEGTAFYVEQQARQSLFNQEPILGQSGHGWARFYQVGAALCRLLDATVPDWTTRIEQGASSSDLIIAQTQDGIDLESLGYENVLAQEQNAVSAFRTEIAGQMAHLENTHVVHIQYGKTDQQYKAFNPSTLVSLGDGRILHRTAFTLLIPGRGSITVTQGPVIDHVLAGEIILPPCIVKFDEDTLHLQTDAVQIDLTGVDYIGDCVYSLL